MKLPAWLYLPEAKAIRDLDLSEASLLHAHIIERKYFLKKIYISWYTWLKKVLPDKLENKILVEVGSGGGFLKKVIPSALTSDSIFLPFLDLQFSAQNIPFRQDSIDVFFLLDVFHHIHSPLLFLEEAFRCLKPKGRIIMIEPANTIWGRFVFSHFHHEPFDPSGDWLVDKGGRLTSANGALPWIIFCRDRKKFGEKFPLLRISQIDFHMPLLYLLSGGVSVRQLMPSFTYPFVKGLERLLSPFKKYLGMFLTIELIKES